VPAINKGRRPQLLNDFCIFSTTTKKHFQHTWCSFWRNFLITSHHQQTILFKMCDQFYSQSRHWTCD